MNDREYPIMSVQELNGIEERMRQLDDHALIRLVAIEESDYQPQAIDIARKELGRRHLTALSVEEYYNRFPHERLLSSGFCVGCHTQTTDESPGDTSTFNFVGTRLIGIFDRCAICGSVLQRKWFCLLVPIVPLSQYRVIYLEETQFYSHYIDRKLRKVEKRKGGQFQEAG